LFGELVLADAVGEPLLEVLEVGGLDLVGGVDDIG